jgi:ribosomal protein S18 acetylase RimI-like enzyme
MTIRLAKISDLYEVHELIKKVGCSIMERDLYVYSEDCAPYREFIYSGFSAVAVENDRIVGCLLTYADVLDSDGIYKELGYDRNRIQKTLIMENCVVDEEARGNGLQKSLVSFVENLLKNTHYENCVCTVHPNNKHSLNNMLDLGYCVSKETVLYGGKKRLILEKHLQTCPTNLYE